MIIDVHVHALGRDLAETLAEVKRQCRINGVSLAIVSLGGRHVTQYPDEEDVRHANDDARRFTEESEGLCQWLAYLNPQNADWREELDRCVQLGAIGVKLWCALKDEAGSLDNAAEVVCHAGGRDLPVLIHTWQKTAGNSPGEITFEEFATLADRCPSTKLIGAHIGGNWKHSIGVLRDRAPNAHVDLSGYYPERGIVEALVRDIGAERVVFGSDLTGRTQASQLAKLELADITEEQKELIRWENLARIFGLQGIPKPGPVELRSTEDLPDFRTDHFCFCGNWPFYEGRWVKPAELDALLEQASIDKAYVGDFDSLYRQDLEWANNSFLAAVQGTERLMPLATMSPCAHNWRSVIRHLRQGFAGAIVHPYLHNWQLDDPTHAEFFRVLAAKDIPVWVNCALADDRTLHTGSACRRVSGEEVAGFCENAPANSYVFQGLHGGAVAKALETCQGDERFRFDISKLTDQSGAMDRVLGHYGSSQLVMGSEFPLRDLQEVRWTAQRI